MSAEEGLCFCFKFLAGRRVIPSLVPNPHIPYHTQQHYQSSRQANVNWQSTGIIQARHALSNVPVPAPPIRLFAQSMTYNLSQYEFVSVRVCLFCWQFTLSPADCDHERRYFHPNAYMPDVIESNFRMASLEPAFFTRSRNQTRSTVARHGVRRSTQGSQLNRPRRRIV